MQSSTIIMSLTLFCLFKFSGTGGVETSSKILLILSFRNNIDSAM